MSQITSHILDTSRGLPAENVCVVLFREIDNKWHEIGCGRTNSDGRVGDLLSAVEKVDSGNYKLKFDIGSYFELLGLEHFYPYAEIVFKVAPGEQHYHVPLLLNPFGYSTYRGS